MKISVSKSEAMVLSRKPVDCAVRVGNEALPQVKEFKYLGVLFTSEGRAEKEISRRIGAAGAVLQSLYRTVVTKRELSRKAKLSVYRAIFVPTLTYGHEVWVMTERIRSRIQAAEMSFLRRVAGVSLRDRVRSAVTREGLGVEPLLLRLERSSLGGSGIWLGCLSSVSLGRSSMHVPLGGDPGADQGPDGGITSTLWPWTVSGSSRKRWLMLLGSGKPGALWWRCCPRDPTTDKRMKMDGWMDGTFHYSQYGPH